MANNLPPPKIAIFERVIWSAGRQKSLSVRSGGAGFDRFRHGARNCPFDTSHLGRRADAKAPARSACRGLLRLLALEGDRAFLRQHLEVGAGHLGEPAVVEATRLSSDHALVDGYRVCRCHSPQVVDGLGDPHPRGRRRVGQYVHRLVGTNSASPGCINLAGWSPSPTRYEILSMTGISGWITACRPPTPRTVSSPIDNSSPTCTACHGAPSCAAVCGSAYSAASGLASISDGSRATSAWSGCWWVIRTADRPVIPSNPCAKVPGSKRTLVWSNSASRQEWPKCVNCMSTIVP